MLVVAGDHTSWPTEDGRSAARASSARTVDRTSRPQRDARLPRLQPPGVRGVQGAAQRRLLVGAHLPVPHADMPDPASRVLARYDDGAVAAAERRTGAGRVIVWTSTLDDIVDRPGGQADLPAARPPAGALPRAVRADAVVAHRRPGRRPRVDLGADPQRPHRRHARRASAPPSAPDPPGLLELTEQGIYEVRAAGADQRAAAGDCRQHRSGRGRPDAARSDGARRGRHRPCDARRRRNRGAPSRSRGKTPSGGRRSGGICSSPGVLLLAAETVISNRLSRKEKFL